MRKRIVLSRWSSSAMEKKMDFVTVGFIAFLLVFAVAAGYMLRSNQYAYLQVDAETFKKQAEFFEKQFEKERDKAIPVLFRLNEPGNKLRAIQLLVTKSGNIRPPVNSSDRIIHTIKGVDSTVDSYEWEDNRTCMPVAPDFVTYKGLSGKERIMVLGEFFTSEGVDVSRQPEMSIA